ncbi:hypothetical protein [Mucilaginibacter sp.]|jgi:hypothetical protein|uniref:hypothetical protein n=1 Tax=Mucilaginibacter sp. TaxID=1882438 RepID=UPI002CF6D13F|nr:hypothetical protein [Mucilaginibacter sp.]HTI58116.1 hypothetical protein [Mucilaginibacter sp.]
MPFQKFIFFEKIYKKGKLQEIKIHFEKKPNGKKILNRNFGDEKKYDKMIKKFLFKKNDQ